MSFRSRAVARCSKQILEEVLIGLLAIGKCMGGWKHMMELEPFGHLSEGRMETQVLRLER